MLLKYHEGVNSKQFIQEVHKWLTLEPINFENQRRTSYDVNDIHSSQLRVMDT